MLVNAFEFIRKGVTFTLFLLFFAACSGSKCPQWEIETVKTCYPCYNSGKIYLYPEDDCRGLELEISRTFCDTRMYINVYALPVEPQYALHDTQKVPVTVYINDTPYQFLADRFQGGQRFLLPQDITCEILAALSDGLNTIYIKLDRYESEITAKNFAKAYTQLKNLSIGS